MMYFVCLILSETLWDVCVKIKCFLEINTWIFFKLISSLKEQNLNISQCHKPFVLILYTSIAASLLIVKYLLSNEFIKKVEWNPSTCEENWMLVVLHKRCTNMWCCSTMFPQRSDRCSTSFHSSQMMREGRDHFWANAVCEIVYRC